RLCATPEHSDEELVTIDSSWHRVVVLINDLEDHEIFHKMHPTVVLALGGKAAAFGGGVLVEESLSPCLYNASARFLRQYFRAGEQSMRLDVQASGKLLIWQNTRHGGVGNQHLRLPGVETLDNGCDWFARGQANFGHPPAMCCRVDPRRHMKRGRRGNGRRFD